MLFTPFCYVKVCQPEDVILRVRAKTAYRRPIYVFTMKLYLDFVENGNAFEDAPCVANVRSRPC